MVVAVAGNIEHDAVVRRSGGPSADEASWPLATIPVPVQTTTALAECRRGIGSTSRPLEQVEPGAGSRRASPAAMIDASRSAYSTPTLGGGTSSRLFQEVRERRGLAYSVFSFSSHHADAGWSVSRRVACPASSMRCSSTVRGELVRLAADGNHRLESRSGARANCAGWLGARAWRTRVTDVSDRARPNSSTGRPAVLDEVIERLDAVTRGGSLLDLAAELFIAAGTPGHRRPGDSSSQQQVPIPAQAQAHSTLLKVPMMNRSAVPVCSPLRSSG